MATSSFPVVKAHLVEMVRAASGLRGVKVDYGDPGGALQREHVFFGGTGQDGQSWGPLGQRKRNEVYGIEFLVHVANPGQSQQDATERAHDLFGVIETIVRALPDSTLAAAGVYLLDVMPSDVAEWVAAENFVCAIVGQIVCKARI